MNKARSDTRAQRALLSLILLLAIGLDYATGPFVQFPVLYVIPVVLAAWYSGQRWGLSLAFCLPLIRFFFSTVLWSVPWSLIDTSVNAAIRIAVLATMAVLAARAATKSRELEKEVDYLEGLLPICSFCKRIRLEDEFQWVPLEQYVTQRSDVSFSHSFCADCVEKHYPGLAENSTNEGGAK